MLRIAVPGADIPDHGDDLEAAIREYQAGFHIPLRGIHDLFALGIKGITLVGQILVVGERYVGGIDEKGEEVVKKIEVGLEFSAVTGRLPDILVVAQVHSRVIYGGQQMPMFRVKDRWHDFDPVLPKPRP